MAERQLPVWKQLYCLEVLKLPDGYCLVSTSLFQLIEIV